MGQLSRGEFGPRIKRLIEQGVVIICGNCGRQMQTRHGPRGHLIYDDGSGRCFKEDGFWPWSEDLTPGNSVPARFGASPDWVEVTLLRQTQARPHLTTVATYDDLCAYMDAVGVTGPSLHPRARRGGHVDDTHTWNGWNKTVTMGLDANGGHVSIELWHFASGHQDHEANGHLSGDVWERLAYPLQLLPALPVITHPEWTPGQTQDLSHRETRTSSIQREDNP